MNRRSFIKNTALAATMVGIAPSVMAGDLNGGKKKKVIFVFRGVSFSDGENAFKKLTISDPNIHFQKVICDNPTYTHADGLMYIREASISQSSFSIIQTEQLDRYKMAEVIADTLNTASGVTPLVHLHHTEIGHSSNKLYLEQLDEFFAELTKIYNPQLHRFVITADIGRNEKLNSCGGKDHSNSTCLETFAMYLGGKASKLKTNTHPITQNQILEQKF